MDLDKYEQNILKKSKIKEISYHKTDIIDIPKGHLVELRGISDSGILYLGFNIIKSIQKDGGIGLLIDSDHTSDIEFFKEEKPVIMHPNSPQETFNILSEESLLNGVDIVLINSVLNLLPLDGNYTTFSKNLSKLYSNARKTNTTIIILNPYTSNRYNILSIFSELIIVAKKTKTLNKHGKYIGILGEGIILKNRINLQCNKFNYEVIY